MYANDYALPDTVIDAAIEAELDAILFGALDGGPLTEAARTAYTDMRDELKFQLAVFDAVETTLSTAAEEAQR